MKSGRAYQVPSFQLAHKIAALANITPEQAWKVMEGVIKVMTEALKRKEKVEIRGLGGFHLRYRKPFTRNVLAGYNQLRPKHFPGKYKVYFDSGKELKYMVNHEDYT